jgi:hypothetical protein
MDHLEAQPDGRRRGEAKPETDRCHPCVDSGWAAGEWTSVDAERTPPAVVCQTLFYEHEKSRNGVMRNGFL